MQNDAFLKQIDGLLSEFDLLVRSSKYDDYSDVLKDTKAVEIATRAYAAIERASGKNSLYSRHVQEIRLQKYNEPYKTRLVVGVLRSLSVDLKAGYLQSLEQLVHGELFSDFLDMAHHLVQSGYKDAGAVVVGSSLEAHLRQLAKSCSVDTEKMTAKGTTEPKKADMLNADLFKAGAYSILDQKNVTAWLDLRNKAAHEHYTEYQKEQVEIMIDAVRNFITRYPA